MEVLTCSVLIILERLSSDRMSCDGKLPEGQITLFLCWIEVEIPA
jgi:hypothetical protein